MTAMGAVAACDCCGGRNWTSLFTERGVHLGRCADCGLLYVAEIPSDTDRACEIEQGSFAAGRLATFDADAHQQGEDKRAELFAHFVDLVAAKAPAGPWLDVGCGAGSLMRLVEGRGIAIQGIELDPDRCRLARAATEGRVYDQPLEVLGFPDDHFAAIILINVFSHLPRPSSLFHEAHRVLAPGGVILVHTSEIGAPVQRWHKHSWELGDHLHFLGDGTIERYGERHGFQLEERERVWEPEYFSSRQWLSRPGRSMLRNALKRTIVTVPGLYPLFRGAMLWRHRDNPIHRSNLLLRKGA